MTEINEKNFFKNNKELSQPVTKFLKSISGVIGKASNSNYSEQIECETGSVLEEKEERDLMLRTTDRLLFQETQKQKNIDSVLLKSKKELESATFVKEDSVDNDWLLRFFNSVGDISNERMQSIWAKILAGEIKEPNSFSLRTLEKLKNISPNEAKLFQKISNLVLIHSQIFFVTDDYDMLRKYNCSFSDILKMEECGFMNAQTLAIELDFSESLDVHIYNGAVFVRFSSLEDEKNTLNIGCYKLTETGVELYKIIDKFYNSQYVIDLFTELKQKKDKFVIKAYKVNYIVKDDCNERINVNYDDAIDLLTNPSII